MADVLPFRRRPVARPSIKARPRRSKATLYVAQWSVVALGFLLVSPSRFLMPPAGEGSHVAAAFTSCGLGGHAACVVDGDTIWLYGEKIRLLDFNTPEISSPGCDREYALAVQAKERLIALLNAGPFDVSTAGDRDKDRYGRKLRLLSRNGVSLGDQLISEGLAHRWQGVKQNWCA